MKKLPIATVTACGLALVAVMATAPAWSKLPPLSEEAQAKAAEATAPAAAPAAAAPAPAAAAAPPKQ